MYRLHYLSNHCIAVVIRGILGGKTESNDIFSDTCKWSCTGIALHKDPDPRQDYPILSVGGDLVGGNIQKNVRRYDGRIFCRTGTVGQSIVVVLLTLQTTYHLRARTYDS